MLYLRLNESNQIIICDQSNGQVETMDCEYTVASVEGNETSPIPFVLLGVAFGAESI